MSRIVISVLCLQISLIHSVFGQYSPGFSGISVGYGNPGFGNPGLGYGTAGMGMPAPGMASPLNAIGGGYGGVGTGDLRMAGELPVAGTTAVTGQVPIVGAVEFRGNMPAGGVINISGSCGCTGKPTF